jgi:hypothetical protein
LGFKEASACPAQKHIKGFKEGISYTEVTRSQALNFLTSSLAWFGIFIIPRKKYFHPRTCG